VTLRLQRLILSVVVMSLGLAVRPGRTWGASADVIITSARFQVIMESRPAAGYFILENRRNTPLVLSGASAPDCKALMLHQSATDNGIARMAIVGSVAVAPHSSVRFAPAAYHLMCTTPSGVLLRRQGNEPVALYFTDGSVVSAQFAIQGVGQGGGK
jgi:copper(I)-binding protein